MQTTFSDWSLLRYFLEVARAGSFLGATERLQASQPTIGRKIDELEQKVGEKLLIRTTHGIDLTEVGTRILGIAEKMEAMANAVMVEATSEAALSGTVRFKVTDGIGGYWLPLMLEEFHANYPHITVEVSVCDATHMPDLSRREADITVVYSEPTDPNVCVLARDEAVGLPIASRSYIAQYGKPTTLEELLDHRFCAHDIHFMRNGPWERLGNILVDHKKIVYRSNSTLAVCQAVRRGLGISYMPIGVMDREPDLVFWDIESYAVRVPFWLVCHRNVKDIPSVRALIEHVKVSLFRGHEGSFSRRLPERI
jgi:DNA-binding transcriptional LysR family regulator